jgi:RNA polymerase sigma-70 factor (ECF subfamily)
MTPVAIEVESPEPTIQEDSDEALMGRICSGDRPAFTLLLDRHLKAVTGFSYRMLGDAAEAEDVAQETFLRLWRYREKWRPEAQLRTWLYQVARNLCIDRFRRREVVTDQIPEQEDPRGGPAEDLQRSQVSQILNNAMKFLPERQRAAITMVYHQELSNIEAAETLGVSVDALESLLSRGRRGLKNRMNVLQSHLLEE